MLTYNTDRLDNMDATPEQRLLLNWIIEYVLTTEDDHTTAQEDVDGILIKQIGGMAQNEGENYDFFYRVIHVISDQNDANTKQVLASIRRCSKRVQDAATHWQHAPFDEQQYALGVYMGWITTSHNLIMRMRTLSTNRELINDLLGGPDHGT